MSSEKVKSNSSHGDAGTSAPQEEPEVEAMTKKQRKKMRCGTRGEVGKESHRKMKIG